VKTENTKLVIDTYAWIEFFLGSEKGELVKKLLLSAEEIYTPSVVLAEIARKYVSEDLSEKTIEKRLKFIKKVSIIIEIDQELALKAGKTYFELVEHAKRRKLKQRPGLIDAIILATARKLGAKIVTGDQHFKGLEETIWIA